MSSALRAFRRFGGAVAVVFLSSTSVSAQDAQNPDANARTGKIGGQVYKTMLGAQLLMPFGDVSTAMDSERLPSGRAVLEIQSNPVFGWHFGAMRLAPNLMWQEASGFPTDLPKQQVGLTAGIVGFRLNFTTGRYRIAPFADAGAGQAQTRRDIGGYEVIEGGTTAYRPVLSDSVTIMAGGGGGLQFDAIIGPGLTLSMLGGYWHWAPIGGGGDDTGSAEPDDAYFLPISGIWGGAGVKLAFRNETYYWRHSGEDRQPPVIAVLEPTPTEDGIVDVGEDQTTLEIELRDQSGLDSLRVNGQTVRLIPVTVEGTERVSRASVPLPLSPGPNTVRYAAYDGAGNRIEGAWQVNGIPLDQDLPEILFVEPVDQLGVMSPQLRVVAVVKDRSPIESATLNGTTVRNLTEGEASDRELMSATDDEFVYRITQTFAAVEPENRIEVAAVDSAGNIGRNVVTVMRTDLLTQSRPQQQAAVQPPAQPATLGPQIEIYDPAAWAGGGTRGFQATPKKSIRVTGVAQHAEGVDRVFVASGNGEPVRMSLNPNPQNPQLVEFSGFVAPPEAGSTGEVEIVAHAKDGTRTIKTYRVQVEEAARTSQAQVNEILGDVGNRKRWAVVIGVSDYQDEGITDLAYADDDAQAVYDFLRSPAAGLGGIPESNIELLLNEQATTRNVRSALTTFLRQSTPDDVIFIYIAGHGAPDPYRPDDLYILTHDTEVGDLPATAIPMNLVNDAMQDAYAYNKVLITDACHSAGVGANTRSNSYNQINSAFLDYMNASSGGFVAFTASSASQLSQEGEQYGGGHGVFTYYLLEGLNGAADDDGDRVVTLVEAMEYTRERVRRETRNNQIPAISLTTYDQFWPLAIVMDPESPGDGS